jgi:cytidine deaminase
VAITNERIETALSELPAHISDHVSSLVKSNEFSGQLNTELAEYADALLPLAAAFSQAPISGFHVGAIAIGQTGQVYLGTNLEFEGISLNATLHAEQSALMNAWTHGETALRALHIPESPCGHCRQFLRELSKVDSLKIHIKGETTSLSRLLPHAFGDILKNGQGLLDSPTYTLAAAQTEKDPLRLQAIEAARLSYAPYSRSPEGCIIECDDGQTFTGRCAESVAFNPTISSLLVALNQRNLSNSREASISSCSLAKLTTTENDPLPMAAAMLKPLTDASINVVNMDGEPAGKEDLLVAQRIDRIES